MPRKNSKTLKDPANDLDAMDWYRRIVPQIAGERRTTDGLVKRRAELQSLVRPHLTKRKTGDAILFEGRRRYLKPVGSEEEIRLAWAAILALQCLYHLEAAMSAGDMDAVVCWTYGFAQCDFEVVIVQRCGWEVGNAISLWKFDTLMTRHRHQKHVNAGAKKRKFKTDDDRRRLKEVYEKNRNRPDWLKATTNDLLKQGNFKTLSTVAVKNELRRMGIVR
jgi:hypothetical protein